LDQNLFRQFLYANSSSFFNWLSFRGNAYREAGPFTLRHLSSRDLGATLEFTVGRPWGKNALVTGYSVRDLQYGPLIRAYLTASPWLGLSRKMFDDRLQATLLGEYIRAWRVQDLTYVLAQAMRPALRLDYQVNPRWEVEGKFAYDRGQGFHAYDNTQSEI